MENVADFACSLLESGRPLVLAKIVVQGGSAPRGAGSQMAVASDGRIAGTIGGGLLEARAISQSLELLRSGGSRWLRFDPSHQQAAPTEMICGGAVEVLLDLLLPQQETVALFNRWRRVLAEGRGGLLVTRFDGAGSLTGATTHGLLLPGGERLGSLRLPDDLMLELMQAYRHLSGLKRVDLAQGRLLVEPALPADPLFIFGAGHVALPTARLAAMVGFRVEVVDDRAEFANRQRFPDARALHVVPDFGRALEGLAVDSRSGIVILTRGHLYDRAVLAQALRSPARYIGMLGSRRKREAIYASLLGEGFTAADLGRVHSPIGLAIGAESPEEIAVSIVGELIRERAGLAE
jgi:xanthine dehydrogenase accessory factor